jgi:hypothetical protein
MLIAQKLCKVRNWTTIQSLLLHFVSFYLLKLLFDLVCYCVALIKIFVISLFICQKHAKYVFDDSVALIKIFLLYCLLLKGTRDSDVQSDPAPVPQASVDTCRMDSHERLLLFRALNVGSPPPPHSSPRRQPHLSPFLRGRTTTPPASTPSVASPPYRLPPRLNSTTCRTKVGFASPALLTLSRLTRQGPPIISRLPPPRGWNGSRRWASSTWSMRPPSPPSLVALPLTASPPLRLGVTRMSAGGMGGAHERHFEILEKRRALPVW